MDSPLSWDAARLAPSATRTASNSSSAGQRGMAGWGDGGCHKTRPGDFKSEPKVSLPIYRGKAEWRTFWLQFERLAQRFVWRSDETLDGLVSCLHEEALDHFAALPTEVQCDLHLTTLFFTKRFDDHRLPETYRASLPFLNRQSKESLEEFAAPVHKLVPKAYPGIAGSVLLEDITFEHLVGGLADQTLMYDVLTKKPRTVEEAQSLSSGTKAAKEYRKGDLASVSLWLTTCQMTTSFLSAVWIAKLMSQKSDSTSLAVTCGMVLSRICTKSWSEGRPGSAKADGMQTGKKAWNASCVTNRDTSRVSALNKRTPERRATRQAWTTRRYL